MNKQTISLFLASFFLLFLAELSIAGFFGSHKKIEASGEEIIIPVVKVNDGKAHYFVFKDNSQEVKFFVVKSSDGMIRAAFDACDVCFHSKKGYTQDGEFMICNNCGRKFHSDRINVVEGGCNPAPLNRVESNGQLVIQVKDVLQGAKYF